MEELQLLYKCLLTNEPRAAVSNTAFRQNRSDIQVFPLKRCEANEPELAGVYFFYIFLYDDL